MGKIALTRQYSAITDFVIFAAVVAHIECIVYIRVYVDIKDSVMIS